MGLCRCDRSHRESQLGRINYRKSPACERPCQIRHQDAVKIPGRERYVTDSKTAAKPSSGFTIHGCQAFQTLILMNVLQTNQIELQNVLHSPRTTLAVFD